MKYVNCFRILAAAFAMVAVTLNAVADDQLDRIDLEATSVTGNQELPKVLYIVPWKESGIGELTGKPVNSLLDEALAPLDREVFQRQVSYFEQLYVIEADSVSENE
jgi:hypothetical protein